MPEDDFFHRAYGSSPEEFLRILAMPSEFIKHRRFFEDNGMVRDWRNEYDYLTDDEKDELVRHLSDPAYAVDNARVASMDRFYHITKESCMN